MAAQEPNEYVRNLSAKAQMAHRQAAQRASGVSKEQQLESSIKPEPPEPSQQSTIPAIYTAFMQFQTDVGFLVSEMIIEMRDKDDEIRMLQRRVEELEAAQMTNQELSNGNRKSLGSALSQSKLPSSRR